MYHPEKSLGRIWQPRLVDRTPIDWRVSYILDYIVAGPYGYGKFDLMQLHFHYPRYYLPLEYNQDDGRVVRKVIPLDLTVGFSMEPTVVLPQEQTELLPQELPLKWREVTSLVTPWY